MPNSEQPPKKYHPSQSGSYLQYNAPSRASTGPAQSPKRCAEAVIVARMAAPRPNVGANSLNTCQTTQGNPKKISSITIGQLLTVQCPPPGQYSTCHGPGRRPGPPFFVKDGWLVARIAFLGCCRAPGQAIAGVGLSTSARAPSGTAFEGHVLAHHVQSTPYAVARQS